MKRNTDTIIIGAGFTGQMLALAEAKKGKKVKVLDRSQKSNGASVRNLGFCLPIGQSPGLFLDMAMRSKSILEDIALSTGMYIDKKGILFLAREEDEVKVLEEFVAQSDAKSLKLKMMNSETASKISPGLKKKKIIGALHSKAALVVDPRELMHLLPLFLNERYDIDFHWENCALHIEKGSVYTSKGETLKAKKIYLCNGADFETLYPEIFLQAGITKCKLQMMRTQKQPGNWRIGPAIASANTLFDYPSFSNCKSINKLRNRIKKEKPELLRWGIQLLATQMADGSINIGESKEYGWLADPFDKQHIYQLIQEEFNELFEVPNMEISETWHSVYTKSTRGENVLVHPINDQVTIVSALGGESLTLAPGLAEKITAGNFKLSNFAFVSGKR